MPEPERGTIHLTWGDPRDKTITKYQYRVRVMGTDTESDYGDWVDILAGETWRLNYRFEAGSERHNVQLRAFRGNVSGPHVVASTKVPPAPTGFNALLSGCSLTLNWHNPNDDSIGSYRYRTKTFGDENVYGDWAEIVVDNIDGLDDNASILSATVPVTWSERRNVQLQARLGNGPGRGIFVGPSAVTSTVVPAGAVDFRAIRIPGSYAVQFGWVPPTDLAGSGIAYWALYADRDFGAPVAGFGRIATSRRVLTTESRVWPPRQNGAVTYHLVPVGSSGAPMWGQAVSSVVPHVPNVDGWGPPAATAAPQVGEVAVYRTGTGVTVMWGDARPGSAATGSGEFGEVSNYTFGWLDIEFTSGSSTWIRRIGLTGSQAAVIMDPVQGRVWHDGYLGGSHDEAISKEAAVSVRVGVRGRVADESWFMFSPWTAPVNVAAAPPPAPSG